MAKILIVDDVKVNTQLMASILNEMGYQTRELTNGADAVELVNKEEFDLVLLDIMMPGIDGIETCRQIKKDQKHNDLPIIFLSAKNDSDSILSGFEAGGQDYLTKSYNNEELLARIKTHLELRENKHKLSIAHQELANLDTIKTDFLRVVTQKLKLPLNNILKTTHLLKELVDSKELMSYISMLDSSAKDLEKFSATALHITNLKLYKKDLVYHKIFIKELIEQSLFQLSNAIVLKKLNIEIGDADNQITVQGDHNLLMLGFSKLIETLIDRYPDGSDISLSSNETGKEIEIIIQCTCAESKEEKNQILKQDNQNLEIILAKLIFELHSAALSFFQPAMNREFVKLTFVK